MSPRTKTQLKEFKENKRRQILEAAMKVFAKNGYNGATISMVAGEAAISKGLLYTYFDSKEILLDHLLKFGLEKAAEFMKSESVPAPVNRKTFAAGLRSMVALFRKEEDFWRLYCMLILQKNMTEKFEKEVGAFFSQYLSVYTAYFKQKGCANPEAEAMLFGSVLDGLMFDMLVAPHEYPVEEVINNIIKKFA